MHNNRVSRFDFPGFFEAINAIRMSQNKSRKQVAEEAGISPSTLTHMAQGYRPDPDTMAALIDWSGLDFKSFIYNRVSGYWYFDDSVQSICKSSNNNCNCSKSNY